MALRACLAAAGTTLALALSAAPALATDQGVSIVGRAFAPTPVMIDPGETVTWTWNGTGLDLHHSVTSDMGSATPFDSDPMTMSPSHTNGDTFPVVFPTSGCFQYHCKVHSDMHGQVQVGLAMCPPPSSGGGGAGGGSGGNGPPPPPPPGPPAATDTTAPSLGAVSAKSGKKLVFKLSEPARVTIKVLRGKKTVKTFHVSGKKGTNTFRLTHRGLKTGKYKLTLSALDTAGNKSRLASARVKL
jgi:plastocyanin